MESRRMAPGFHCPLRRRPRALVAGWQLNRIKVASLAPLAVYRGRNGSARCGNALPPGQIMANALGDKKVLKMRQHNPLATHSLKSIPQIVANERQRKRVVRFVSFRLVIVRIGSEVRVSTRDPLPPRRVQHLSALHAGPWPAFPSTSQRDRTYN